MINKYYIFILLLYFLPTMIFNDTVIKQGDNSVLNIGEGDNNITNNYYTAEGISEEMYERLYDKYGANKALIKNFLATLNHKNIPPENFQTKLEEIAKHYQFLMKRLARFTPQDPETNQLKQAAQVALSQGHYAEAEKLLNHASDRDKEKADHLEKG